MVSDLEGGGVINLSSDDTSHVHLRGHTSLGPPLQQRNQ